MDPNQTTGTTSSGVNDIDPIGSDSGAGITPTGASSCKYSGKKSNAPRSVKDDVQPPKHWTVRHSRDPKRPIRTQHGRKFAMTPAAGHDPPKLKLQWTGRNQHWTPTPTKHSNPIPERIDGEAGGAKNKNLTTKPFYPRESNSVCDQDLQSSRVR
ncbi:hypothetical protein F2Q70_00025666 [Brassica cretica]|uniref:Uncharacterized protein n=1 Tax=Brassica cretica TaxID=69181 RepID=A0A8S9LEJ4_BRACR|nr:hypothetical protein F2Q70_00025666 [Brassica cretica]KAF3578276.1 hypothetical protein DY000_02030486 [Brassica cretica]